MGSSNQTLWFHGTSFDGKRCTVQLTRYENVWRYEAVVWGRPGAPRDALRREHKGGFPTALAAFRYVRAAYSPVRRHHSGHRQAVQVSVA